MSLENSVRIRLVDCYTTVHKKIDDDTWTTTIVHGIPRPLRDKVRLVLRLQGWTYSTIDKVWSRREGRLEPVRITPNKVPQ